MRARVTLGGLVPQGKAGPMGCVPWLGIEWSHDAFHVVGADGSWANGLRDRLGVVDARALRVARRLHSRTFRRSFRDGALDQIRSFESEARSIRSVLITVGFAVIAFPVLGAIKFASPWWVGLLMGSFMSLALLAVWLPNAFQLPYFGAKGITHVVVRSGGLEILRRSGERIDIRWSEIRRLSLIGVPLIELYDGRRLRVPGVRGIGRMLSIAQSELFKDDAEANRRASRRVCLRTFAYFPIAGVSFGTIVHVGQQQGWGWAMGLHPFRIGFGLAVVFPLVLCAVGVLQLRLHGVRFGQMVRSLRRFFAREFRKTDRV